MSSPRPASRPKALLPSALPHDHEGASSSPPWRPRPAAAAGAASTTTAATAVPSKTQAPQRPSSSSTTHTMQSRAMQSVTATGANYSQVALSGGDEQYSSAPILIEESSPYPHLQPFFTLVDDGSDPGHPSIHPSVNYIFADDDQEPITGAAIRIDSSSSHHAKAPKRPPDPAASGAGGGSGSGSSVTRRRSVQGGAGTVSSGTATTTAATTPEVIERCVLITLGLDGRSIESAVSLTPDWHVNSAELSAAPTLDGDSGLTGTSPGAAAAAAAAAPRPSEEDSTTGASTGAGTAGLGDVVHTTVPEGPLMLRIRGSEVPAAIGQEEALGMGLDGLFETFRERLAELKKVVDAAAAAEPLATEDEGEE